MTLYERYQEFSTAFWAAAGGGVFAFIAWSLRRLLTNTAQIKALEAELVKMEAERKLREEKRDLQDQHQMELLRSMQKSISTVEADVKSIFRKD